MDSRLKIRLVGIGGILAGVGLIWMFPYSLLGVGVFVAALLFVYYTGDGAK